MGWTVFYTVTATPLAVGDWIRGSGGTRRKAVHRLGLADKAAYPKCHPQTQMSWAREMLTLWNTNSETGNESNQILKINM